MYRRPWAMEPTEVDTVPFGCFRRLLWEALEGLDGPSQANEDDDFNHRVRRRGLRVVLDPAMRCTYFARPTVSAVARQYGRYGWWKARMLIRYPRAIRVRQLIPALLMPALIVIVAGAVLGDGQRSLVLLAGYPVAMLAGAAHAAATRRRWAATGWLAAAFITMHVMWSAAFWASLAAAAVSRAEARP